MAPVAEQPTIRPHTTLEEKMERILIAVDESEGGRAAVEEGLELAKEVGADVTFLTVRPSPPRVLGAPFYSYVVSEDFRQADRVLRAAMESADDYGLEAEYEILEGDPADEIVGFADNRGVDLIVIGSRGLGALAGALLGSVSRAVVQHAQAPVLVAKTRVHQLAAAGA